MELTVIGINHRTAPVEVREAVALSGPQVEEWLRAARLARLADEMLVLSTCNRTEFYLVHTGRVPALARLLALTARVTGTACRVASSCFYRHTGPEAVRHLFRVAASLDSQVVGEHEIIGQVKAAYSAAVLAHTTRTVLNRLLHRAFRVGKRVRAETKLCEGTASVPQAAVECAREVIRPIEGRSALVLGAGQTAELAAHALIHAGVRRVVIANRTLARARKLAADLHRLHTADGNRDLPPETLSCPGMPVRAVSAPPSASTRLTVEAVALGDAARAAREADLVFSSIGAPEPIVTRTTFGRVLRRRRRPILIIDLAVPRDIDPAVAGFPAVRLRNMDDLRRAVEANLRRRQAEIPRAEAIVEEEARAFDEWLRTLEIVPTVQRLQAHFEAVARAEIARERGPLSASDRARIEGVAKRICRRLLHDPVQYLRTCSTKRAPGAEPAAVDLVRQVFNLDAPEGPA